VSFSPSISLQSVYDALSGRWRVCGPLRASFNEGAPVDAIGVEFVRIDLLGNMYYLVDGPNGPVRGAGSGYMLTYDVSILSPGSPPSFQVNIHPTPNSGFGGTVRLQPCPRKLEMSLLNHPTMTVLESIP
jgi:hypothetical protein